MASYTGGETMTLTTGALVGSTVANITMTGADAYARVLNINGAEATTDDLRISSGGSIYLIAGEADDTKIYTKGSMFVSGGVADAVTISGGTLFVSNTGVANNVYEEGTGGTARVCVSNGGVVNGLTTSKTVEVYLATGGTLNDIAINPSTYMFVAGGTVNGGYHKGTTLQVTAGTLENVTIYKTSLRSDAQGWRDQLQAGTMINCTVATSAGAAGAIWRQTGGTNTGFTVRGSGAVFYASGGTLENATAASQGKLSITNSAVVTGLHLVNGGGGAPTVYISSGGVVNGADNTGDVSFQVGNGGTANDIAMGAGAFVFIYDGGKIKGGYHNGTSLEIYSGGVVEDLTIYKPRMRDDKYANNDQMKDGGTMSNCTLAVSAGASGAKYRQTGGTNIGMTVTGSGAEFNVSGGTLTGMLITNSGTVNATGGSFTDTTVEGYANLYASAGTFNNLTLTKKGSAYLRGATVNNLQMVNGGSIPRLYLSNGGVVNGGETTGTVEFWGWNGAVANDVTFNSGAYVIWSQGAVLSGGTFNGDMLEMMGGTIRELTIKKSDQGTAARNLLKTGSMIDCTIASGGVYRMSGGTATNTKVSGTFNISAGVADGVTVYDGGRANISAAATGVVESGGFVNIVNNAEVAFVDTVLENHIFSKAATVHAATTAESATIVSGGALHVLGGNADHAVIDGGQMTVSSGTVRDITVNDGGTLTGYAAADGTHGLIDGAVLNSGATLALTECAYAWGEENWLTVNDVEVKEGATVNLKNFTRLMNFDVASGAVLNRESNLIGFGGENTNVAKGVFFNKATGAEDKSLGEEFEIKGGVATGLDMNGDGTTPRSCFVAYSGLTVKDASVISGGSLYFYSGARGEDIDLNGKNGVGSAYLSISGATVSGARIGVNASARIFNEGVLDKSIQSGGMLYLSSGATANSLTVMSNAGVRGSAVVYAGATVNSLTLDIKGQLTVYGGVVNDLYVSGNNTPTFYVENGGVVVGGSTSKTCEVRASNGGIISGMTFNGGAYIMIRSTGSAAGVISDCYFNGARLQIYEGGIAKNVTIAKTDYGDDGGNPNALKNGSMIDCTIISGAQYRMSGGVAENTTVAGNFIVRGGVVNGINASGVNARVFLSNGGVVSGALIEDYAWLDASGGVIYDPVIRMNSAATIAGSYARINLRSGAVVSGGRTEGIYTHEIYANGGAIIRDMTFNRGAYCAVYTNAAVSGGTFNAGATIAMRGGLVSGVTINGAGANFNANGGTIEDVTVSSGTITVNNNGVVRNATLAYTGGSMLVQAGAGEVTGTVVSSGARIIGIGGLADGVTVSSGGSAYLYASGGTVAKNLVTESGATIIFDFIRVSGATLHETPILDSLANVAEGTVISANTATNGETFTLAEVGNSALKMAMTHEGFTVNPEAGKTVVNAWGRQYTINAEGTTFLQDAYNLVTTTEAADLATSGAVINGGDKALRLDGATMTSGSAIAFVTDAAGITGDAWVRFSSVDFDKGATVYGADNDFDGTMKYLIHGAGNLGNFAAGAKAGGKVGGVELVSYNNDYGVTYLGGQGTVTGLVSAVISSGNVLSKDFYAGALANFAKNGSRTSVGSINATIRLRTDSTRTTDRVKGNIYGASQVKAGTIDTSLDGFTPIHTVGDVNFTLAGGTADKSDICVFAAGYANGTDSATGNAQKAVYTVDSVTAAVSGGNWGKVHGGRGIFGGAFAAGVRAEVAEVDLTVSGGTMGNVYGGGWAQRGGVSAVGNVNISIKGGTLANVFGGGTTSTSGGATEVGSVTITVSGGTISNAIYARGQFATDVTGTASVVFTGAKNFTFADGVYGYSYVGGAGEGAALSFSDYTGSFTGKVGGFDSITLAGNSMMTLAADDVKNTAWTFDAAERDAALAGTAFLNWSDADFTGDTITLNLASGDAVAWDLVSTGESTVYNKFDVRINGTSILSETIDIDDVIAGTGTVYDNWGFTDDNGTLKFKQLA